MVTLEFVVEATEELDESGPMVPEKVEVCPAG